MKNQKFALVALLMSFSSIISAPFEDNGNGTVKDSGTKLIWQKCGDGQDPLTCEGEAAQHNWMQANIYCTSLKLENKKWRLPKREEIAGLLVLDSQTDAKIDPTAFPKTAAYRYWSSTPTNAKEKVMWTAHFFYGDEKRTKKEDKGYSRCVSN